MRTFLKSGLAVGCAFAALVVTAGASSAACSKLSAWGGGSSKGEAAGQASTALDRRAEVWAYTGFGANYAYRSSKNISCKGKPGNWDCTARAKVCTARY